MNETKIAAPQSRVAAPASRPSGAALRGTGMASRSSTAAVSRPAGTMRTVSAVDKKNTFVPMNIGKYQTISLLAEGGQGKVYLAYDTVLDPKKNDRVVIKELKIRKKDARERFKREVKILRELRYERHVVSTYEFLKEGSSEYIVLEYVDGMSLSSLIEKQKGLPVSLAMYIFLDICKGLRSAHKENIIHRDIKPDNVLISKDGEVKLTDFGISGSEKDFDEEDGDLSKKAFTSSFETMIGTKMGTPSYMSPEQIDDTSKVDKKTDIYSMGVMLYEMLFADKPFVGSSPNEIMAKVKQGNYIKPSERDKTIPASVNHLIVKMMAKDKEKRYKDMDAVIRAVNKYLGQFSPQTRGYLKSALKASIASKNRINYYHLKFKNGKTVDLSSLSSKYKLTIIAVVASAVLLLAAVGYATGLFHETILSPWFASMRMEIQVPQKTVYNGGSYATDLPATAYIFHDAENAPDVDRLNKERRFYEDKKGSSGKVLRYVTRPVYLKEGDYLVKIALGPYVYWKSVTLEQGRKLVLDFDSFKGERRTKIVQPHAVDAASGLDITEHAVFEIKDRKGKWIPLADASEDFLAREDAVHVRASCEGYESKEFSTGLKTQWYQDTLIVEILLNRAQPSQKEGEKK
ncbi:MAG: serine/threonine protein kinase [Treponema sp.]|nr:serine/threonine protein kinase [Treponema sp.]